MKVEFEGRTLEFHVQYGRQSKLFLQIAPNGFITVKAPKHASQEEIMNAVLNQGSFIMEKLDSLDKARNLFKAKEYTGDGTFLYLGREHRLEELIGTEGLNEEERMEQLKKFYFAGCKTIVSERLPVYQQLLKVKPKTTRIVESATKWGSCGPDKKLTFNYRLAMAPVEVTDYVIVHELCHLLHMNHDRSFWRKVGSIMPDYKDKEAYLARYGRAMTL